MKARVQKWGNSLALRIPKAFAAQVGISQDSLVDVSLVDERLVITPLLAPSATLEHLLAGITEENLHGEIDTGPSVGREAW